MNVPRVTQSACHSSDPPFPSLLSWVATNTNTSSTPLPFKLGGRPSKVYEGVWNWYISKNYLHVDLKILIQCTTNHLLDEHNDSTLNTFPGSVVNLYSSTSVEPQVSTQHLQESLVQEYVVPGVTFKFCPTAVLPHHMNL